MKRNKLVSEAFLSASPSEAISSRIKENVENEQWVQLNVTWTIANWIDYTMTAASSNKLTLKASSLAELVMLRL